MRTYIYPLLALAIICNACKNNPRTSAENSIITIDITKEYATKELCLQDIAEVEYIPLETNDSILLDGWVTSISDNMIVFKNNKEGAAYLFNKEGSFQHKFCRQGESGTEYKLLSNIIVDSLIYVQDLLTGKIYIYNLEGEYKNSYSIAIMDGKKRSTKEHYQYMTNFDKSNLLLYKIRVGSWNEKEQKAAYVPYALFSKETGEITPLNLEFDRVISSRIRKDLGAKGTFTVAAGYNPIIYNEEEIYITEFSSDTTYCLKPDGSQSPLFVRTPLIKDAPKAIGTYLEGKSNRYWFISTAELEFDDDMEKLSKGIVDIPFHSYMYDAKTSEVSVPKIVNRDFNNNGVSFNFNNAPKNCAYRRYSAYRLVEAYQNNELSGELKKVASKLKEDDNDVIMFIKFKE